MNDVHNLHEKLSTVIRKDDAVDKLIDAANMGNVIVLRKLEKIAVDVMQLGEEKEIVNELRNKGASEDDIIETVKSAITYKLFNKKSESE